MWGFGDTVNQGRYQGIMDSDKWPSLRSLRFLTSCIWQRLEIHSKGSIQWSWKWKWASPPAGPQQEISAGNQPQRRQGSAGTRIWNVTLAIVTQTVWVTIQQIICYLRQLLAKLTLNYLFFQLSQNTGWRLFLPMACQWKPFLTVSSF